MLKALKSLFSKDRGQNVTLGLYNLVTVEHRRNGKLLSSQTKKNLVTDAGFDWLAALIGNAAGTPANYIALTSDSTAVASSDTTLTSEYAAYNLSRAAATYAHTGGTKTLTLAKTFTSSADSKVVAKTALFNQSSNGSLFAAVVLSSSVTLMTNDTLTVTWTITLS